MKTVDIHTHLLNPNVAFNRPFDRLAVRFFAKKLGTSPQALQIRPYETYVEAITRSVRESEYVERICLFGVDARLDEQGRELHRDKTVCAFTEDVLQVHAEHPDCFIPFLSVHPWRDGALSLIDEYVERGCRGAKFLQNYWGLDLNDEHLLPYYEKLKFHDLPLIIHIGSEYSISSFSEYEGVGMLKLPLLSGVTVIAAHMGLGRFNHRLFPWRNLSRNPAWFDRDYFQLLELLAEHDNLYGDISAILSPMRARALRHLSEQTEIHPKLLFGTDYPVPFSIGVNSYDMERGMRREINGIENPFDRYAQAMLYYFPEESPIYSNYRKILDLG